MGKAVNIDGTEARKVSGANPVAARHAGSPDAQQRTILTAADLTESERVALEIACRVGMPRVCRVRKCRQARLCLGLNAPCLAESEGLGKARFRALRAREAMAARRRRSRQDA